MQDVIGCFRSGTDPGHREVSMVDAGSPRTAILALVGALAIATSMTLAGGAAAADAKYPSWKGQWIPVAPPQVADKRMSFDPGKPPGVGQQAPLTQEYQKVLNDSLADQANGGFGNDPTALCYAGGMPRMMTYEAQEY